LAQHTAGELLQLVRLGEACTRSELAAVTGLARSTVSQRVDLLIEHGYLEEAGDGPSSGGRPPTVLRLAAEAGVILVADLGATHCRIALTNLVGDFLAEHPAELDIAAGPEFVLTWVLEEFDELLEAVGRRREDVRGIGVGLPGPVEFGAGRAVNPPIMPGWDGVSVPDILGERFDALVLVDNDVNIMALGEYHAHWRGIADDLLFIKVGTGIGSGILAGGRIHRGAQGAAGDLGHVQLADHRDAKCRCGNRGCVEALASGGALARRLTELGLEARTSRDVVSYARDGAPQAVRLIRDAGRMLGEVLAGVVNFYNPAVIIIGGDVAAADDQLLAGIREVIYQRSTALATRSLPIERSRLGDHAGATGAAVMVLEQVFSSGVVDAHVSVVSV
jgi:predicted NBD/HSP70 family sugar kinase